MKKIVLLVMLIGSVLWLKGQETEYDSLWTLDECISYALKENIQVRRSEISNVSNEITIRQNKASRYPSLDASSSFNNSWRKAISYSDSIAESYDYFYSTSLNLSSSVTVFNAFRLNKQIERSELDYEAGKYNTEAIKESVSLSILSAFLQVLYAEEQVVNSTEQIAATEEQLNLAEQRLTLGIINQSNYLQVKSQLASEKLTLVNAQNQLSSAKIALMQYMVLPTSEPFEIVRPDLTDFNIQERNPDAQEIYTDALGFKPEIKYAELNKESAALDEAIAKSSLYPSLSLSASTGMAYSSNNTTQTLIEQLNRFDPSLGISLRIPIYQRYQAKASIAQAKISYQNAELSEIDTRNQLRQSIEQASNDVTAAQASYMASEEQYLATSESYKVAEEQFNQGIMSSVDFLFEKTNLISAESQLLQRKYQLIFSYKILDFYTGIPLTL